MTALTRRSLLLAVFLAGADAGAQRGVVKPDTLTRADTSLGYVVRLTDGSRHFVQLLRADQDSAVFRAGRAELRVSLKEMQSVRAFQPVRGPDGEVWFPSPQPSRLLFAPTAIPLDAGERYFWDFLVFFVGAQFGITDRLSVGVGSSLIPGADGQIIYFTPKLTLANAPRAKFAVGVLAAHAALGRASLDSKGVGIVYGVGTLGSAESNLSVGTGWGYYGGDVANRPVIMIGGQHRFAKGVAFLTENWFACDQNCGGVATGGLRFLGERMNVDLVLSKFSGTDVNFVPIAGFGIRF